MGRARKRAAPTRVALWRDGRASPADGRVAPATSRVANGSNLSPHPPLPGGPRASPPSHRDARVAGGSRGAGRLRGWRSVHAGEGGGGGARARARGRGPAGPSGQTRRPRGRPPRRHDCAGVHTTVRSRGEGAAPRRSPVGAECGWHEPPGGRVGGGGVELRGAAARGGGRCGTPPEGCARGGIFRRNPNPINGIRVWLRPTSASRRGGSWDRRSGRRRAAPAVTAVSCGGCSGAAAARAGATSAAVDPAGGGAAPPHGCCKTVGGGGPTPMVVAPRRGHGGRLPDADWRGRACCRRAADGGRVRPPAVPHLCATRRPMGAVVGP